MFQPEQETPILCFIAPPGGGKQYSMQVVLSEYPKSRVLKKITTRPARSSDGLDTISAVEPNNFHKMVQDGQILMPHQPFGIHWYGHPSEDFRQNHCPLLLAEPNIEHTLRLFREQLGQRLYLVGLAADFPYLSFNMRQRGEQEAEIEARKGTALAQSQTIRQLYLVGVLDELIELDFSNRQNLKPKVLAIAGQLIAKTLPRSSIPAEIYQKSFVKSWAVE